MQQVMSRVNKVYMLRTYQRAPVQIRTFLSTHARKLRAGPNGCAHACMYFHARARW